MNRPALLLELDAIIAVEPGTLTGEEQLDTLKGWDSLAIVQFIALADSAAGLTLAPEKIGACKTVNDLLTLLETAPRA